jgi:hypothetical protein
MIRNAEGRQVLGLAGDRGRRSGSTTCAGSTTATGRSTASPRLGDRDVCGAAPRHRQLALVGRAVVHPHGQEAASRPGRPSCGSCFASRRGCCSWSTVTAARAQPVRGQARPGHGHEIGPRRAPCRHAKPGAIAPGHGVRRQGGEAPTPYEVLLLDAIKGNSARFTRQDSVEESWRLMAPLLDSPPPVTVYPQGSWGPPAAERLVADFGGWHGPWIAS